jgi:hypothetical protein
MSALRPPRRSWNDEAGFIVSALIVRFLALLVLFGVAAYDTTQCLLAQVRAESVSRAAATAGADTYYRTKRSDMAEVEALAAARKVDPTAKILSFSVNSHGAVTVSAEKLANTLVVSRWSVLRKYGTQRSTDQEIRTQ